MTRYSMNIDTSDWGAFDPSSANDQACERERLAWTEYTLKRLRKMPRTGSDEVAIWTGAIMALVQIAYAVHQSGPPDSARDALHQMIDFSWLQCAAMAHSKNDLQ